MQEIVLPDQAGELAALVDRWSIIRLYLPCTVLVEGLAFVQLPLQLGLLSAQLLPFLESPTSSRAHPAHVDLG